MRVKNVNRSILAYLRIWILSNNEEVGLYRQTLSKLSMNKYHVWTSREFSSIFTKLLACVMQKRSACCL